MKRLCIFALYLCTCYASIVFPTMQLSYRGAQLTPRGNYHPVIVMTGREIIFENAELPAELYAGKVLMMAYRPYWDVDVCRYQHEYNVSCIVITSTNPYTPGGNLNKGLNQCVYDCAFEMLYPDFQEFAEKYQVLMLETLGTAVVTVDLDGTEPNQWKEMVYSPLYMINVALSGLVCVAMIVFNTINLTLIYRRNKTHMKVWIMICALLLMSGIVGNIGFVDFNCYSQVLPYRMCTIFSSIRPAFVFAAINLLSFTFMDAVKMHLGGPKLIPSKFWVFCTVSFAYLAMTITCAVTITYLTDYDSLVSCLVIWLALELGYQAYTAALNGVISIKTLIRLRASVSAKSGKMGVRKAQVARMTTMLIVIASCTVIYVIFVGLVNQSVYYPWYLGSTWLVYNMLLNVISLILTISMYQNVTKNMDKKKTSSKSTESAELSKQRSSTLDVTAVTRTSSTTELETPH